MSIFVVPVHDNYHRRPSNTTHGRCGPSFGSQSAWDVNPFHRRNAIPHSFFSSLFDVAEDSQDTVMELTPWEQQHIAHLRQQKRQELLHRQQQAEQEREERERIRREREKAARLAWQEQQRKAAIEYQKRVEAYKKHQQEVYAERVKIAKQRQAEWDQFASQALVGVMDFVEQLFGGEEESKTEEKSSRAEEKKPEKIPEQQKSAENSEKMQVDEDQHATTDEVVKQTEQVEAKPSEKPASTQQLVFTYPLPQDETARKDIKADSIDVTYDADSKTINLTGLWSEDAHNEIGSSSSSTVMSESEERGRKRSRSPKKSRVSDVDETTGEEITKSEVVNDAEDDYVEVNPTPKTVSKSIRLPDGATVDNLRAEITDEGFKVWI